jgi:hypothetical protein
MPTGCRCASEWFWATDPKRPKPPGKAVGKTLVSSSMIDKVVEKLGRRLCEVPVGFKWFVCLAQNSLPLAENLVGPPVVQHPRREQAYAAVMVLGVVPGEESLAKATRVLDGAETVGKLGPVL